MGVFFWIGVVHVGIGVIVCVLRGSKGKILACNISKTPLPVTLAAVCSKAVVLVLFVHWLLWLLLAIWVLCWVNVLVWF